MSMTGVIALVAATAAANIDPRKKRVEELEATVARLTEERDALIEAANAFVRHLEDEKERADTATKKLLQTQALANRMADGYARMANAFRHAYDESTALSERLARYEGRHVTREHICCVPQRSDFFYRAIESMMPRSIRRNDMRAMREDDAA